MNKTLLTAVATGAIFAGATFFGANNTVHADSTESFSMKAVNFKVTDRVLIKYNSQGAGWTKPYGDSGAEYVMPLKNLRYFMVNIQSERIDQDTGTRWLEVNIKNINGGKSFWIDAAETSFNETNTYFTQTTTSQLKVTNSSSGYFLSQPWGVKGTKVITNKNGTQWAQVTINGKTGWLDINALSGDKTLATTKDKTSTSSVTQSPYDVTAYNRYGVILK